MALYTPCCRQFRPYFPGKATVQVARGDLGLKSGRGFHDWSGQDAEAVRRNRSEALVALMARLGYALERKIRRYLQRVDNKAPKLDEIAVPTEPDVPIHA